MSTTKVLHVIARMNVGGTARYVGDLVENIPGSALATGYVQGAEIEDPIVDNLETFRIPHLGRRISPFNDLRAWIELRRLVRDLRPEVVHTHTFKAGLVGRLVGGNHKRIHTFHGHLFGDQSFSPFEKRLITSVERFLARRTDLLISVGERVGLELREVGIGLHKNWISIPPGVKPLSIIDKQEARGLLGLESGTLLVGWMARMTRVKNPYLLLEVAALMPEVNFVMAGGGDLLEDVKRDAPPNVKIIGWCNASYFWSAMDCAISTSDNEGMPIALIEAQLAGIPVVATDVGSNAEVIVNGVTGYVAHNEASALIAALKSLIVHPTTMKSMSFAATHISASKFNRDAMIFTHTRIYSK